MVIEYAEEPALSSAEFLALVARQWPGDYSRDLAQQALARTINVTARADGALVGCVRLLTDGYFFTTVLHVLVSPEHRGQGIGRALIRRAWERAPTGVLFAAQPGDERFFAPVGFERTTAVAYSPSKPRPGRAHDADWDAVRHAQEPWDYARFQALYNALAEERGGWHYEPGGRTEDELRARYQHHPQWYPDLAGFADALFTSDQRVD